ncbi:MAG: hypothetical protein ACK4RW_10315 [Rehaibacterium terrae]|uniref:hypothetical protein n=1 Tax=Rehaibacterium terrae TaxID=1341696 RepID=UPI00391AF3B4
MHRNAIHTLTLALGLSLSPLSFAAPTVSTIAGNTSVTLDAGFVAAAASLGVEVGRAFPGRLNGGVAIFPIPAGEVDLANARGEIAHRGGLDLRAGDLTVTLSSFVIDTTGDAPVLTGLVKANDSVVARLPLFDIALTQAPFTRGQGQLIIEGAELTLTGTAAAALNDAFGLDGVFAEGFPIGVARVQAVIQ